MTKDRSCSSEEALQAGQERARAVYCVIRNIWTILKRGDGQRRWNVISSHSWLEERRLWLLMSTCGTAAAIQHKLSLLSRAQLKARARAIHRPRPNTVTASAAEISSHISCPLAGYYFSHIHEGENDICIYFLLTSQLSFGWLHKCASVFPLMTCSITDKHLSIGQFCRQPSKWAATAAPANIAESHKWMQKRFGSPQQCSCGAHL